MKIFLALCAFINRWLGTTFGEPSRRFRRRDYYRQQHFSTHFVTMLNQHLLLHLFLYKVVPSDSMIKFEHDDAVKQILGNHIRARAAQYSEPVFKYIDKHMVNQEVKFPFCHSEKSYHYPLYELSTTVDFESSIKNTDYYRYDLVTGSPTLQRDNDDVPLSSGTLDLATDISLGKLSRLDTDLVDTVLHRYILALDDTSILNANNCVVTLNMIKGIQTVLEAVCFMQGVYIKSGRAEQLIDKLKLCAEHRYGVSPNEDNPTQRCLAMLVGGKFNRGVILTTYLVREHTDVTQKWAIHGAEEEGSFVYFTYNSASLIGKARHTLTLGKRHQWFQVFDFKRVAARPKAGLPDSCVIYRDEILDFKQMLFEDKTLESWKGAIITDINGIPTGETL